jgi:hypothetical protein
MNWQHTEPSDDESEETLRPWESRRESLPLPITPAGNIVPWPTLLFMLALGVIILGLLISLLK